VIAAASNCPCAAPNPATFMNLRSSISVSDWDTAETSSENDGIVHSHVSVADNLMA
jgi:hypothetical protein